MEGVVVDLLRTPELQRLRKIRQLGLAHLVFPGAEHSRLTHSLGAAFLAIRFGHHIAERAFDLFTPVLCPDESSIRDLAIGALCHDLGHGPLSHAFEREVVGRTFDRAKWQRALGLDLSTPRVESMGWHEIVTQGLLRWKDGLLHQLLEQHEEGLSSRIGDLLLGDYYIPYLPRLLDSDVDVDRADFIRRDTLNTGVAYGRYDLNWMISTCSIGYRNVGQQREWVLGFEERKAVRVVEQFLIARRAMYDTVYHHKTVHCAEGMVALFLRRLKDILNEGSKLEVVQLAVPLINAIKGLALAPAELLALDDFTLSVLIDNVAQTDSRDATVRDLALRIRSRDLFKQVPVHSDEVGRYLRTDGAKERLYDALKPFVPGDPRFYLVHDEAQFRMLSDNDTVSAALIRDDGEARFLREHATFSPYLGPARDVVRLFTVREATGALAAIVKST